MVVVVDSLSFYVVAQSVTSLQLNCEGRNDSIFLVSSFSVK